MTGTNGTNVSYAHPLANRTEVLEFGQETPRTLESGFEYDTYGNQTRQADYGIVVNGDRSAFDDERVTTTHRHQHRRVDPETSAAAGNR